MKEALFALVWVVLTALIEVWVALKFGCEEKRQLSIILTVNVITHGVLFFILNGYVDTFPVGGSGLIFGLIYFFGGLIEILIERVVYEMKLDGLSITRYIKVANIASYVSGALIAVVLGVILGL